MSKESEKFHLLSPQTSNTKNFKEWIYKLNLYIQSINQYDITQPHFEEVASLIRAISEEVYFELGNNIERTESVYDRPDYVVREMLRTAKVPISLFFIKSFACLLADGKMSIKDNAVIYNEKPLSSLVSQCLLVELPSLFALLFTSTEVIAVVNIDDLLRSAESLLVYASVDSNFEIETSGEKLDIFAGVFRAVQLCMNNLSHLNNSLFFTLFDDLGLFKKFIASCIEFFKNNNIKLSEECSNCLCLYISASQSESDLNKYAKNPEIQELYKSLLETVVKPRLKEGRENRAKYRSILHYSKVIVKEDE